MYKNLLSKRQTHKDDCAHFCALLRKAELYSTALWVILLVTDYGIKSLLKWLHENIL